MAMAARCMRALAHVSAPRRAVFVAARAFSQKADGDAALSSAAITKMFMDMDATTAVAEKMPIPMKLTGRSGEIVRGLYEGVVKSGDKDGKKLERIAKELAALMRTIESTGLVIHRFFTSSNYSNKECKLVVETLLTTKEPLTSFDSIKNADVKDLLVDNEGNLDLWRNTRKAITALGLLPEVAGVLETLGNEGRLELLTHVAQKAHDLRAVTIRVLDAEVKSAVPLSKEQQDAVTKALPKYAEAGQTLNVAFSVDPAVLGGLLVTMKNQTIDLSSTSRLVEVITGEAN